METAMTYVIGMVGIVVLMLSWALVQSLWKKTFSENISDEDVLAERRSCGNCGCGKVCKKE